MPGTPMSRTARLVEMMAQGIEADTADIAGLLREARARMDALQADTKGLNGMASLLRQKSIELGKIADDLTEEADLVARKLRGQSPRPQLVATVDEEKAEAVREARVAS